MVHHAWTVLCWRSVIDRDTNNVSIHDVLEQLTVGAEPTPGLVLPIEYQVVSLWAREHKETGARGVSRITLIPPMGTERVLSELAINLSEVERMRHRLLCHGFEVPQTGRYYFRVEVQDEGEEEWRQVALVPLTVLFVPQTDAVIPEADHKSS